MLQHYKTKNPIDLFDNIFNLNLENSNSINYDIIENDNEFELDLILAGFKKKDVNIKVEDNELLIEGKRNLDEERNFYRKGSFFGEFNKVFTLPKNTHVDKIRASFDNGILKLKIPKEKNSELSKIIKIE